MSASESNSESNSDTDDVFDDILNRNESNAFAFEPEYSASEVDARQLASQEVDSSDDDSGETSTDELEDGWCTCEKCLHMEQAVDRVCCRSLFDTTGNKFGSEKCITSTAAFQDVCLNTNVLEAALGTWRHLNEQQLEISNKSYRFIGYRQFISWIYGWLGKDVRKRIPS